MMNDGYIDRLIGQKLLEKNKVERANHKSSGKLSASALGQPLQWQVLHHYGVPSREIDEYVIRKFLRGKNIEEWLLEQIETVDQQKFVEYRGAIGYIDAMIDTTGYDFPLGIIPHEIKSVANMKYKRIMQRREPDKGHLLQACLYALATESAHFAIDYIAADDLRVTTYVYRTEDYKDKVDAVISRYDAQIAKETIPVFTAEEDWQANVKYCNYPEWLDLKEELPIGKLTEQSLCQS